MQLRSGLTLHSQNPAPTQNPTPTQNPNQAYAAQAPLSRPSGPSNTPATTPSGLQEREAAFIEAVRLCLGKWTALQLAVENQWGGRNSALKAQQLGESILEWFGARSHKRTEDGHPLFYADELEDFLDESVMQSFNVDIEDGSLEEVSGNLLQAHEQCRVGDFSLVLQWQQIERQKQQSGVHSAAAASRKLQTAEDDDSDDSADEMGDQCMDEQHAPMVHPGQTHHEDDQMGQEGAAPKSVDGGEAVGQLTDQEAADGWQQVPSRRSGRR